MLYACVPKFDVMSTIEIFLKAKHGLKKQLAF